MEGRAQSRAWLRALLGVALFAAALAVLHRGMRDIRYRDVERALAMLPRASIILALGLTAASYAALTCYDLLAFRYIAKPVQAWRVAVASFVGYAISNNVGLALLAGGSVRYRFYSRWGIGAADLSRLIVFYATAFWLGLLALGGWSLAFHAHPALIGHVPGGLLRGLGVALLALCGGYIAASFLRKAPLRIGRFELPLPRPHLALLQLVLSLVDWTLAAAVLAALLPADGPGFGVLLGAFLAAQVIGLASHVPGGLGVFEGSVLVSLAGCFAPHEILSSLVLYRITYYLVPLALALAVLVADEIRLRRRAIARVGALFGGFTAQLAPKVLALFTFLAGVVLLASGALPADPGRLHWLGRFLPLGVFEASHFLGSIAGVGLLFVAQGVARRLDAAYYMAVAGLILGMLFSLLKAGDFEEAIFLAALLLAFLPTRSRFDRRAALTDAPFSPGWTLAATAAVGASIWLGLFAYRHVQYANELWWRFALDHNAPRFLRASVGAAAAVLAFGVARLIRVAPAEVLTPSEADLAAAERIIAAQSATLPFLVFLRDKGLLFDDARTAFVMFAVHGRSWVALGDPVGPAAAAAGMIGRFLERADDCGGIPVFYEVRGERLQLYADRGLTFAKLGEEARVRLAEFSVEGHAHRGFRSAIHRFERAGGEFRVVAPQEVPPLLDELRAVSDDWLAHRRATEKAFSLGFFDEDYLSRFPVAVLEAQGRILAFANLWLGPDHEEFSVDLMRFRGVAPKSAMDVLFSQLMAWGRHQGYTWFSLGMAPLAGLEQRSLARRWSRFGHWLFLHGGAFYDFQGLRSFKAKFGPCWEPRYLAYPGGLSLPRVLADVAALVAGGYRNVLR